MQHFTTDLQASDFPQSSVLQSPEWWKPQTIWHSLGISGGSDGKETACNAGDPGSNPGSGKSLGEGNGNPLQYSCLENIMDRGAWRAKSMGSQRVRHNWVTFTLILHSRGTAKFTSGVNGDFVWGKRKKKDQPLRLWASLYGDGLTMRIFKTLFGVIKLQWFGPVELRKEMKEKEIWAKWQQAVPEKKT